MSDSTLNVFKAIIGHLKRDKTISALVGERIFSNVPQSAECPYLVVGISSNPFDTVDVTGMEHRLRVKAFSRESSPEEALQIRSKVYESLNRNESAITVANSSLVRLEYSGLADCFRLPEDEGISWQSIIDFTLITQEEC